MPERELCCQPGGRSDPIPERISLVEGQDRIPVTVSRGRPEAAYTLSQVGGCGLIGHRVLSIPNRRFQQSSERRASLVRRYRDGRDAGIPARARDAIGCGGDERLSGPALRKTGL